MGVIHAKLKREKKKEKAAARLSQAGPKSLGPKQIYSSQILSAPTPIMHFQWELSTKLSYATSPSCLGICASHHLCLQIKHKETSQNQRKRLKLRLKLLTPYKNYFTINGFYKHHQYTRYSYYYYFICYCRT